MSPIVFFLVIKEVVLSNKYDGRQIKNALWIFAVSIKRW